MTAAAPTYQWTVERYHQAIDAGLFDEQPVELLHGALLVMPPERELHAYSNSEVGDYLRQRLGDRAKVREAHPITLNDSSEPIPDLAIVKPRGRTYLEHHPYPEDIFWLVEFSQATLAKDLGEKKAAYASAGIAEYWVVDLKHRCLHVFRHPQEDRYQSEQTLHDGAIAPLAFADISIDIDRLLLAGA